MLASLGAAPPRLLDVDRTTLPRAEKVATPPEYYGRSLLFGFAIVHLSEFYFGRRIAWGALAAIVLGGLGNEDVCCTDYAGGFVGMSFRFFDPDSGLWSIYWADSRRPGLLDPPVLGSFSDGVGIFEGDDTFEGRPIRVRFTWSGIDTPTPRWEQAFSDDGGETWETNWIMDFKRSLQVAA